MLNIVTEIWKPVYGFEGIYEVSNTGKIKSLPRWEARNFRGKPTKGITVKSRILKPTKCYGYHKVTLVKNGVDYYQYVHRIVMASFEGPSDLMVDHKDENRLNNNYSNLRYTNCRGNHTFYNERRKAKRTSKYIGVNFSPSHGNRWRAGISVHGKATHIGYFDTEEDAHKAYQKKRMEVDSL